MKNRGLAFKLTLLILSSVTLIFLLIFSYNYLYSRKIIVKNIENNARNLAGATVNRIDVILSSVEKVPENLAYFLENFQCSGEELNRLLRSVVENNEKIYGSTVAFEPWAYDAKGKRYAPYYYKKNGELKYANLAAESYEYSYWDWYQIPKELNRPVWSEPYFDKGGGNIIMSTYSVPFYRMFEGKKRFAGIITADISLSRLQEIVASIKIEETGYGFLISRKGTFVTHPGKNLIMNETIF
ncbi:MAG: serine/threonine protein phosphatase, partial [Syntrophobacterales bacterium]|nr:serine/threonine protein phosphatase [Syntrophobacterales bacterium]